MQFPLSHFSLSLSLFVRRLIEDFYSLTRNCSYSTVFQAISKSFPLYVRYHNTLCHSLKMSRQNTRNERPTLPSLREMFPESRFLLRLTRRLLSKLLTIHRDQ
jgi:hypothetical protein